MSLEPTFFESAGALRRWFTRHAETEKVLVVGYMKKATGVASVSWPESVDEALCVGWIDGVRHRIDERRYRIRFSPRKPRSTWSQVNIRRVAALTKSGRMKPQGLAAFAARDKADTRRASYEQKKPVRFPARHLKVLRADPAAWKYYRTLPSGYLRMCAWWIVSAKKPETRARRLRRFIEMCAANRRFTW
jgi:uncharacterized protein YdeI (YjbR/CyaY-like superfamily)